MQPELPRFRELAEASAKAQQMIGSHGVCQRQDPLRYIVHPVLSLSKAIYTVRPVDQVLHVAANAGIIQFITKIQYIYI